MKFELITDLRTVRSGWHWGGVRPASWPEGAPGVPARASNLDWARQEPVRSLRWLIQRGLSAPFARAMTGLRVEGAEWLRDQNRPAILAANHVSHADTVVLLAALPDRVREQTVVGAAADYWYQRPMLGRLVGLWLNTFPFVRTGSAQAVLHSSSQLLKSGWNLLIYPEGTHRVMPKGRPYFLPAPVEVRFGKPLEARKGEGSRAFTQRVEDAVRNLGQGTAETEVMGSWIDRWRAAARRNGGR